MIFYQPPNPTIWQGRKDSSPGERYFQRVRFIDLNQEQLPENHNERIIIGFCSDEGIRRNEGRLGAKLGPIVLREQLGKLACHSTKAFIDVGNIISDLDLELAQEKFAQVIDTCHQQGYKTLALGGGHEIAWGHYLGLSKHYANLAIINFDSHFDLRPLTDDGKSTSGTSFHQIADFCSKNNTKFSYCCLGIQPQANSHHLFAYAKQEKLLYLSAEQLQENLSHCQSLLNQFIQDQDFIYLTICLDVFAESFAPGVSAPQALGLAPWHALPLLKSIVQTGKVVSFDVAELSPPLDQGQKTARLAANLIAELLTYF